MNSFSLDILTMNRAENKAECPLCCFPENSFRIKGANESKANLRIAGLGRKEVGNNQDFTGLKAKLQVSGRLIDLAVLSVFSQEKTSGGRFDLPLKR